MLTFGGLTLIALSYMGWLPSWVAYIVLILVGLIIAVNVKTMG